MSFTTLELILFYGIVTLGTLITRGLPFLLFPEKRVIPKYIQYLAHVLPYTIIGMLVIYCLKDISFKQSPYAIPEFICIGLIIILHLWKKNTLLSIGVGTLTYMILIQFVFV